MGHSLGGKHPLTIQPLVMERHTAFRIQATAATQDPMEFLESQDEVELVQSFRTFMPPFSGRPALGRRIRLGLSDVTQDGAEEKNVRSFLEQPDRSELWMVAEAVRRQINPRNKVHPLLEDYPNVFYVGKYAAVFTWQNRRKLFVGEAELRRDMVYPAGARIIHPIPDLA